MVKSPLSFLLTFCQFAHCLTLTLPFTSPCLLPHWSKVLLLLPFSSSLRLPVSFPPSIHSSSLTNSELRNSDSLYNREPGLPLSLPSLLPSQPPSLHRLAACIKSHPARFQRVQSKVLACQAVRSLLFQNVLWLSAFFPSFSFDCSPSLSLSIFTPC